MSPASQVINIARTAAATASNVMPDTIDFEKYKVFQDSLEGTEKIAAGPGIGTRLVDSAIAAVTARGAGKLMDKVDDAFLRPTSGKGAVSTAERSN